MTISSVTQTTKVSVDLTNKHHREIKQIAKECGTSMSDIIGEAIEVYLNTKAEEVNAKLRK